eukprot:8984451-Pyramimonas_sp.AAC.1
MVARRVCRTRRPYGAAGDAAARLQVRCAPCRVYSGEARGLRSEGVRARHRHICLPEGIGGRGSRGGLEGV